MKDALSFSLQSLPCDFELSFSSMPDYPNLRRSPRANGCPDSLPNKFGRGGNRIDWNERRSESLESDEELNGLSFEEYLVSSLRT
ncbi:hypothetical protein ACE6H2_020539 [Prunus campanulata]